MALPSFSHVWSSRQSESSASKEEQFFLLGGSSMSDLQPTPVFRRSSNIQWFDKSYSTSAYSCCDRSFDTKETLEEHKNGHVKCFTPDCEFTAHPDVVEKHFELQHHNNLYRKVCLTNRPEDISKWISERKRNFPTKDRTELKRKEEENRRARGEVIVKKQFGLVRGGRGNRRPQSRFESRTRPFPPRGRGRGVGRWQGRGRGMSSRSHEIMQRPPVDDPMSCLEKEDEDDRPVEMSSKCPPPILPSHLKPQGEVEAGSFPPPILPSHLKPQGEAEAGGSLSLIAGYDSSSSDEETMKEKEEQLTADPRPQPETQPVRDFKRRDPVLRLIRRRDMCMEDKRRILSRPRLLEMLLARDIQHERNVLMQCCFFIEKRNFFGRRPLPAKNSSADSVIVKDSPSNVNKDEEWDGEGIL